MEIHPEEGKFTTTVQIPLRIREEIKRRGMTIAGCLLEGLKAMDERKLWNADKEGELKFLRDYRIKNIKEKAIKAMKEEIESTKG